MARCPASGMRVIDGRSYSDIRRAGGRCPRRHARRSGAEFYPSATKSPGPALLIDGPGGEKFPDRFAAPLRPQALTLGGGIGVSHPGC